MNERSSAHHEPVAIIGAACRLPGGIDGLDALWRALSEGRDLITEAPEERFDKRWFESADPRRPGKSYTFAGGYLDGAEEWDPGFFGISPREAARIDPQQRMALEMAVEVFDDAGVDPALLRGSDTAVQLGVYAHAFGGLQARDVTSVDSPSAMGSAGTAIANRVSYHFDLRGPSLTVDTACSSSLITVHQACGQLLSGECGLALAGGVNFLLDPYEFVMAARAQMLSPTGRSRAFSADADGFVRAEGGGLVLLKRLSDALADGDRVHAVVLASATNCDGRTSGLAHPSVEAQHDLLRAVYAQAGAEPRDLAYLEAHGTGTLAGDSTECTAIGRALGAYRNGTPLPIGSVKTNVGHLEAAAGVTGLLKALAVLRNGQIPPSLHCENLNPEIDFEGLGVAPVRTTRPLDTSGRGLVGVNSFGAGGANAHLVLAPPGQDTTEPPRAARPERLPLVVSGHTEAAARTAAAAHAARLRAAEPDEFYDLASTACTRRGHHGYRTAVLAATPEEAAAQLDALAAPDGPADALRTAVGNGSTAFVFSGNGSQWARMGADLLDGSPAFRGEVERVDDALHAYAGWSVVEELRAPAEHSRLARTEYAQPALFAVQAGLVAELAARGVHPSAAAGHSVGEIAAYYTAGALDLASAVRVVVERSRAQGETAGTGRMAAVGLPPARAEKELAAFRGRLEIAGINDEENVNVAGAPAALRELGERLALEGVFFRELDLDYAFHSNAMDPVEEPLLRALDGLSSTPPRIPVYSTVTGAALGEEQLDAAYWWRNVREPVLFAQAVRALSAAGHDVFVEVAPHPVLRGYLKRASGARRRRTAVVPTLLRPSETVRTGGQDQVDAATCAVLAAGARVEWSAFFPHRGRVAELPRHPWQRERHWNGTGECWAPLSGVGVGVYEHPLLGVRAPVLEPSWHGGVEPARLPWLGDHRVSGAVVMPAAAFAEMALAAGREALGGPVEVCGLDIRRLLALPWDDPEMDVRTQVSVSDGDEVRVAARTADGDWQVHAQARVRPLGGERPAAPDAAEVRGAAGAHTRSAEEHYARMQDTGLDYGPAFRPLREFHVAEDRAVAAYELDDTGEFEIHPALLDAALQATAAVTPGAGRDAFLPDSVSAVRRWARPAPRGEIHVRLREATEEETVFDLVVTDAEGAVAVEIDGYRGRRFRGEAKGARRYTTELRAAPRTLPGGSSAAPSPRAVAAATAEENASLDELLSEPEAFAVDEAAMRVTAHYAARALLSFVPQGAFGVDDLIAAGVLPHFRGLLTVLASVAEEHGLLTAATTESGGHGWRAGAPADPEGVVAAVGRELPQYAPMYLLYGRCGRHLREVLNGSADPIGVVFPEGATHQAQYTYGAVPLMRLGLRRVAAAVAAVVDGWPADRPLRILEVGGGTGATTSVLLPLLPPERTEYVFTDVSSHLVVQARKRYEAYDFVRCQTFDMERDAAEQDLVEEQFDLVVATNVLHVAEDLRQVLHGVAALLAPGGDLFLVENHDPRPLALAFGLLEGFWSFRDDLREGSPLLDAERWTSALESCGFDEVTRLGSDADAACQSFLLARRALPAAGEEARPPATARRWGIAADAAAAPLAAALAERLHRAGGEVVQTDVRAAVRGELLTPEDRPDEIVLVWEGHAAETEIDEAVDRVAALRSLLDACTTPGDLPRIWIVNRSAGALPAPRAPHAPVDAVTWGMAHALDAERPELDLRHVSLPGTGDLRSEVDALARELTEPDDEDEILLTGQGRFVPRLLPSGPQLTEAGADPCELRIEPHAHRFSWETSAPERPGEGEVSVDVRAAALSALDAARAGGEAPIPGGSGAYRPGTEYAGVVAEVGPGVEGVHPGDRVYGLAAGACATRVRGAAGLLAPIPEGVGFGAAATLPAAFLTVHRGLEHLARLAPGETLFVHGDGGGLALAAVQHARHVGARVVAAAEREAERDLLRNAGADEVLDAADPAMLRAVRRFAPTVLLDCAGPAGTDVSELLPAGGRLVRIVDGRPGYRAPRACGGEALVASIDTEWLLTERPDAARRLFAEAAALVAEGAYRPLQFSFHTAGRAAEAVDWLRTGRTSGHTVLGLAELPAVRHRSGPLTLDPHGSYLVTGGLSGFGAETARWLAERGAGRLALVSRRGEATEGAAELLAELRESGAQATAHAVDTADPEAVGALLARLETEGAPLRGVVHAAVVLRDGAFEDGEAETDRAVLAPKLSGAQVLDAATRELDLDLFVVYSSVTNVVGNTHQVIYGAANSAAESVVRARRRAGLPGLAVQWAGISGIGALADRGLAANVVRRGLGLVAREEAFAELEDLVTGGTDVAAVLNIDWERLADVRLHVRERPRLRHLVPASAQWDHTALEADRRRLVEAPREEALGAAEEMLCRVVARVLGAPPGSVDRSRTLDQLGIDSIMATELISAVRKEFGCDLAIVEVASGPSVSELAGRVVTRLRETAEGAA